MNIDYLFATLSAMADAEIERHEARQRRLRDASNARRRERYAARKAAGLIRTGASPVVEFEPDPIRECYCHVVAMPPCQWCESGQAAPAD